jgi:hypothetical protein
LTPWLHFQEVIPGKGTKMAGFDDCRNGGREPPTFEAGRFAWNLKWKYRLLGVPQETVGTPFYDVTQWMKIIPAPAGQPNVSGFTREGGKGNAILP